MKDDAALGDTTPFIRDSIGFLMGQNNTMVTQTQFADAKAGAMLAFVGLIATRGPGAVIGIEDITLGTSTLLVLHTIALICCLLVLFPRYASARRREALYQREHFSWLSLTARTVTADDYANQMRGADLDEMVTSLSRSNHTLAGILQAKFFWLRMAFAVAMLDVVFMGLRLGYLSLSPDSQAVLSF